MFQLHQSSSANYSYFTNQCNPNPNPNPNPYWCFSALPSTEPTIHPPGIDPYANSGSYPLTHGGFVHQAPDTGSQSWVVKQVEPIRYDAEAIKSLHESSIVSATASSNSLWYTWTNQPSANDITIREPNQTQGLQSMRCEICKIDCNSKDVFEKHILGKKHKGNLQLQINSASLHGQMVSMVGQMVLGDSSMAMGKGLETKRRKLLNGGTSVDSVRVCTICDVVCNSQDVFNKHITGKKHAAQAGLNATGIAPLFTAIRSQNNAFWKKAQKKDKVVQTFQKKGKVVQSAWCEVCKINCNSNDVYVKHLSGKKHQKNVEKLQKPKNDTIAFASIAAPAATHPVIGPKVKSADFETLQKKAAQSQAPGEDLETKKRKVLESGAAAGAVKTCTICNVVCNSTAVFNSHLVGQKHAAMVKKMAGAGTATAV